MRTGAVALAVLSLAACEPGRPKALVMCHNSNCSHTDPTRDDTLDAFHESLALEHEGRSILDGIEIDLIWDPRTSRCVFEHDHADAANAPDAVQVVSELADHLRTDGQAASWNGEQFVVKFELKKGAAPDGGLMSTKDLEGLADCALAMTAIIEPAAVDAGLELTTLYESEDVSQLYTLPERDAWRPEISGRGQRRQIAMTYSTDAPADLRPQVGVVTMNWRWARDGDYMTYQSLQDIGLDLMVWMYDANEKALSTIEHLQPVYIDTNEAPLFRSWVNQY